MGATGVSRGGIWVLGWVGAGYTISPETGDIATYVKLLRVAMLLPVVLAMSFAFARRQGVGRA